MPCGLAAGVRFQFGVERAGRIIGGCSIDPVDETDETDGRRASIGFWIHVDHVRQGLALRIAEALTRTALDAGYATVRIRHDRANEASGRIAERLGFQRIRDEPHSMDAPGQTGVSVVWERTDETSTVRSGGRP